LEFAHAVRIPGNREKCRETGSLPANFGKTGSKSPAIPGDSTKIPYTSEQGIFSAEQGIKVPCSAENRDMPRLTRFSRKRGCRKDPVDAYCT
jgi:hypothetical protein